jgi:hypothetical protein
MLNNCANPKCAKPLHYLREGRVFVFEVPDPTARKSVDGKRARRLEHYWLCGDCSQTLMLELTVETGISLVPKPSLRVRRTVSMPGTAIAS